MIDFSDESHPVKAFRCSCGSELCRDKKPIGELSFTHCLQYSNLCDRALACFLSSMLTHYRLVICVSGSRGKSGERRKVVHAKRQPG